LEQQEILQFSFLCFNQLELFSIKTSENEVEMESNALPIAFIKKIIYKFYIFKTNYCITNQNIIFDESKIYQQK
jgi:hypothetical protein